MWQSDRHVVRSGLVSQQEEGENHEEVGGHLGPKHHVHHQEKNEQHFVAAVLPATLARAAHHEIDERQQADKAKVEDEAQVAHVGAHVIIHMMLADIIRVVALWPEEVAVADDPRLQMLGDMGPHVQELGGGVRLEPTALGRIEERFESEHEEFAHLGRSGIEIHPERHGQQQDAGKRQENLAVIGLETIFQRKEQVSQSDDGAGRRGARHHVPDHDEEDKKQSIEKGDKDAPPVPGMAEHDVGQHDQRAGKAATGRVERRADAVHAVHVVQQVGLLFHQSVDDVLESGHELVEQGKTALRHTNANDIEGDEFDGDVAMRFLHALHDEVGRPCPHPHQDEVLRIGVIIRLVQEHGEDTRQGNRQRRQRDIEHRAVRLGLPIGNPVQREEQQAQDGHVDLRVPDGQERERDREQVERAERPNQNDRQQLLHLNSIP